MTKKTKKEVEDVVKTPSTSEAKRKFRKLVDLYKEQKPEHYARWEEHIEARYNAMK